MMSKKMLAACLAAAVLFALTGCRLAREDAGENKNADRLIGVFVTQKYLDLFDMEGYVKDNMSKMFDKGEIIIDGSISRYQGRLYATLATLTHTNEETGETFDTKEFVFEGVEGIPYFSANIPATENKHDITTTGSDEAISDGKSGLHYSDDEERITLEGTIYISPGRSSSTFYINPIYQEANGSIYAVSGNGISISGEQNEDYVFSRILEETKTVTTNGKSKKTNTLIKITLAVMFPPERIVIIQMDKDSTVLSRAEYTPGELPDTLIPEENTEFIIVETHKRNPEGDSIISRSLYDKSSENIETFYCRDDGICVKQWTQVDWKKSESPFHQSGSPDSL